MNFILIMINFLFIFHLFYWWYNFFPLTTIRFLLPHTLYPYLNLFLKWMLKKTLLEPSVQFSLCQTNKLLNDEREAFLQWKIFSYKVKLGQETWSSSLNFVHIFFALQVWWYWFKRKKIISKQKRLHMQDFYLNFSSPLSKSSKSLSS